MASTTMYIYEENTGKIKYTVNDVAPQHVDNFQKKGIPFFLSGPNHKIAGTFVRKDEVTGIPIGISPFQHMTFIQISKDTIVANGTDEAALSNLKKGMKVDVDNEYSYVVDDETGTTLELSANGYSYKKEKNKMVIRFKGYGYHDSQITINLVEGQ